MPENFLFGFAPVQVSVLNVTSDAKDYASKIKEDLWKQGFRVEVDLRDETLQEKDSRKRTYEDSLHDNCWKKRDRRKNISLRARGMKNLGSMGVDELVDI